MNNLDSELAKFEEPLPLHQSPHYLKACFYGEFGTGKTVLAARCGRPNTRTLFIAVDPGWVSLKNHPEITDIDIVEYQGLKHVATIARAIKEGHSRYKDVGLVIVDTLSEIQENYVDFLAEKATWSKDSRPVAIIKDDNGRPQNEVIPGMDDYHLARNKMRPIVRDLCKAPVDVIFTAHLREPGPMDKQMTGGTSTPLRERRPTLTEKLYLVVARECHLLGFMEREGNKRTIQFETTKTVSAKSRIKELDGRKVTAEELPQIIQKWRDS